MTNSHKEVQNRRYPEEQLLEQEIWKRQEQDEEKEDEYETKNNKPKTKKNKEQNDNKK